MHMVNYPQDCFMVREDGRFDFAHSCIRDGLLEREKQSDSLHARLLVYLGMLPALEQEHHNRRTNNDADRNCLYDGSLV